MKVSKSLVEQHLLLTVPAVIGAIEELAQSPRTQAVGRDQFEINFFANVNMIKAVLPSMREKKNGHIIMLTGISKSNCVSQHDHN